MYKAAPMENRYLPIATCSITRTEETRIKRAPTMYVTLRIDFFMRKCACCQQCVDGLLYLFFYEENIFVFFFHQVLFPGHPFQLFLTGLEALQPGRTLVAQLFVMLDFFPDTGNLPFQFN